MLYMIVCQADGCVRVCKDVYVCVRACARVCVCVCVCAHVCVCGGGATIQII